MEFVEDWFVVFNAATGIDPQSGQLANMAATNVANNGLPSLPRRQRCSDDRVSFHLLSELDTYSAPDPQL